MEKKEQAVPGHHGQDGSSRGSQSSQDEEEIRKATAAMERAASAMIAATECFRRQIRERAEMPQRAQSSPQPYRPGHVDCKPEAFEHQASAENTPSSSRRPKSPALLNPSTSSPYGSGSNSGSAKETDPPQPASATSSSAPPRHLTNVKSQSINLGEEFLPRRNSMAPGPRVDTNAPSGSLACSQDDDEMVDIDISPRAHASSGTTVTQWTGADSTTTAVQNTLPTLKEQSPKPAPTTSNHARVDDVVTAQELSQNDPIQAGPLSSNPTHALANSQKPGIPVLASGRGPSSPYARYHNNNYSTASFTSMHSMCGQENHPGHRPRDSSDPLFPEAAANVHLYHSGIQDGRFSKSLRKAAAHVPRLSQRLPDGTNLVEKGSAQPAGVIAPGIARSQEIFFILVICLSDGLILAGLSQGLALSSSILAHFPSARIEHTGWYTAAYALAAGAFVLPSARLGRRYGHKVIFVMGLLWFALWTLLAGFALAIRRAGGSANTYFIFCRAMQGIGPGMLLPTGEALLSRLYLPGAKKGRNIAMILFGGAAAPVGFVVGSVLSSFLDERASWPWAFWTMAAVCLATSGLALLALPKNMTMTVREEGSIWTSLDLPGMGLLVAALVLFAVGWNEASTSGWQAPHTYFLVIMGVLVLASWVYLERNAPHPLIPLARTPFKAGVALFCVLVGWMSWGAWITQLFKFLIQHRGLSPLVASTQIAGFAIVGFAASVVVTLLFSAGSTRPPGPILLVFGMCTFVLASILLATAPVDQVYWANVFVATLLIPLGMETTVPAATAILEHTMPEGEKEGSPWMVMTVVNYGISFGLGVVGSVERGIGRAGEKPLEGLRGGMWTGVALATLGLGTAVAILVVARLGSGRSKSSGSGYASVSP